jgi:type VI secretion system secreted protein VgrG
MSGAQTWVVEYELSFADNADVQWQVYRFELDEALNRPYRVVLDIATDAEDVDTESLLGDSATLTLTRSGAESQFVYGVVLEVTYLGYVDHLLCVRVELVPAFELLRQCLGSRIWQEASVQDIVSEVLDARLADYDRDFDLSAISRGSTPRDYCVQYQESDFDYVVRLLEEEGISYGFEHDADAGHERLTLRDANEQYTALEQPELPIITHNPDQAGVESLQGFEWARRLAPTASLVRDFDWHTPSSLLTTPADGRDERGRTRRAYVHGRRRLVDDQAQQSTDMRLAAALMGAVARGHSNATVLRPGVRFAIVDHDRHDFEREYIVLAVRHYGHQPGVTLEAPEGPHYANEFICVPADAEIRPARITRKPRVHGPQTAIVSGGDEIHTDEHGRIQVQFYWEESPSYGEGSSCWVRCAQAWAGPGWGTQFIPRVGMEVVVEFIEGNPDRPLVTGCVYNGANPPPFAVPGSKTQSGVRTNSSPGGGGFNELRFEDAQGSEEIYIHGQKDWRIEIQNDKSQTIGHDDALTVVNDQSKTIGHDQDLTVTHDQVISIGNDQSETIGHDQILTVACNQQESIGADRIETIGGNHSQTISSAKTVTVGALYGLAVGAAYNIAVGAQMGIGVGGALTTSVGMKSTEVVMGDKSLTARNVKISALSNCTVDSTKDMSLESSKKLTLTAKDKVKLQGDTDGKIEFAKKLVLQCGDSSITLKKDGTIIIKGKNISVRGSGDVKIKGKSIGNN